MSRPIYPCTFECDALLAPDRSATSYGLGMPLRPRLNGRCLYWWPRPVGVNAVYGFALVLLLRTPDSIWLVASQSIPAISSAAHIGAVMAFEEIDVDLTLIGTCGFMATWPASGKVLVQLELNRAFMSDLAEQVGEPTGRGLQMFSLLLPRRCSAAVRLLSDTHWLIYFKLTR